MLLQGASKSHTRFTRHHSFGANRELYIKVPCVSSSALNSDEAVFATRANLKADSSPEGIREQTIIRS